VCTRAHVCVCIFVPVCLSAWLVTVISILTVCQFAFVISTTRNNQNLALDQYRKFAVYRQANANNVFLSVALDPIPGQHPVTSAVSCYVYVVGVRVRLRMCCVPLRYPSFSIFSSAPFSHRAAPKYYLAVAMCKAAKRSTAQP
jgi:hypothetical protein